MSGMSPAPAPHPLLASLQGGDRRSIGKVDEVIVRVLREPALFDVLFTGMVSDDPVIRMRCADAAEKISRDHPQWLLAHQRLLLDTLALSRQPELRWHVAPMLVRLPLSDAEQARVVDILIGYLNDRSSIVKTLALQALHDLAACHPCWVPTARLHILELTVTGTPAMKARGRKLLCSLDRMTQGKGSGAAH